MERSCFDDNEYSGFTAGTCLDHPNNYQLLKRNLSQGSHIKPSQAGF